MRIRNTLILFPLTMILLLTAACSGEGLFYTIQNEVLVEDNNMSNIKFADAIATTNYYVARGVKIWYRSKTGSSWSVMDTPGDSLSSMTFFQPSLSTRSLLYFTVRVGNSAKVYSMDIDNDDFSVNEVYTTSPTSGGDYVWLQIYSDGVNGNDRIAMNRVEFQYDSDDLPRIVQSDLYVSDSPTIDSDITMDFVTSVLDLGNYPVTTKGVAFGVNQNMWVITNTDSDSLDSGGVLHYSADNFSTDSMDTPTSGQYFQSVSYITGDSYGILLLSSRSDYQTGGSTYNLFYKYINVTGGAGTPDDTWHENDSINYYVSDFSYISGEDRVVASAVGDYYTSIDESYVLLGIGTVNSLSLSTNSNSFADDDNYESSDLIDSYVYAISMITNGGSNKAIAASSTGIWTLSSSSSEWTQE